MSIRVYSPNMLWTPLSIRGTDKAQRDAILRNMERVLERWRWTPYESGASFCQRGADCIGAVFGAIDEMDGRARGTHAGMPADVAMHNPKAAVKAMRELVRRYQPAEKLQPKDGDGYCVQPGDVVVVGERGGGPGHVLLVGPRRNTMWDATPGPGFKQVGWSLLDSLVLWAVYRISDKETWA